jgi:hypothetical protein
MKTIPSLVWVLLISVVPMLDEPPPRIHERAATSVGAPVGNTGRLSLKKIALTTLPQPIVDIRDLNIGWRSHRNQIVAVRGALRCDNEDYCAFARTPELRRAVQVDISTLSESTRRHLILDCSGGCDIIVTGNVDDEDIFALNATDVPDQNVEAIASVISSDATQ